MANYAKIAYADDATPSSSFFIPLISLLILNEVAGNLIFISLMSFFSKIADPTIGGSYMTLLNTLTNLGSKWPTSLSLYLLPKITFYGCEVLLNGFKTIVHDEDCGSEILNIHHHHHHHHHHHNHTTINTTTSSTSSSSFSKTCLESNGICKVRLDGYTIETVCCFLFGCFWLVLFRKTLFKLQSLPYSDWFVSSSEVNDNKVDNSLVNNIKNIELLNNHNVKNISIKDDIFYSKSS
jgi:PAT family acetyl-CoA transporter-like MFS transporter 1